MTEQERFEAYLKSKFAGRYSAVESPLGIRNITVDELWKVWQAATAQAVPKGCVVVPVEPTGAMHKAFYEGKSMSYSMSDKAEFYDDYSAMIQAAQESE